MSENWDFYFGEHEGEPAGVFLNLGLFDHAPDVERRVSLRIATKLLDAHPNGLAEKNPDAIDRLEEDLAETLAARMNAAYVGRITQGGVRAFFFYASGSQGLLQAAREVERRHPEYKLEAGSVQDPKWDQYLQVMYPTPQVMRSMNNMKVLRALHEDGDDLSKPREVDHFAYFGSHEARTGFRREAAKLGFAVRHEMNDADETSEALPFGLNVFREHLVDPENIDAITAELTALAERFEGVYDGWESPVVK